MDTCICGFEYANEAEYNLYHDFQNCPETALPSEPIRLAGADDWTPSNGIAIPSSVPRVEGSHHDDGFRVSVRHFSRLGEHF
jgi:hypothetical protein